MNVWTTLKDCPKCKYMTPLPLARPPLTLARSPLALTHPPLSPKIADPNGGIAVSTVDLHDLMARYVKVRAAKSDMFIKDDEGRPIGGNPNRKVLLVTPMNDAARLSSLAHAAGDEKDMLYETVWCVKMHMLKEEQNHVQSLVIGAILSGNDGKLELEASVREPPPPGSGVDGATYSGLSLWDQYKKIIDDSEESGLFIMPDNQFLFLPHVSEFTFTLTLKIYMYYYHINFVIFTGQKRGLDAPSWMGAQHR